jgi:hypothetical protein
MKPLGLKKIKLPLSTLWAMSDERRSALLLLGLFLNEVNWLRKLLVKALKGLPSELVNRPLTPEEEANHGLTMLMMTTLVGKIWEGWNLISQGDKLRPALDGLPLADSVKALEAQLKQELAKDLFVRIRNNVSFHYSEKLIDLSRLKDALGEGDAHFYVTEPGYNGDMLSYLSTLASIEPVLHPNPNPNHLVALKEVIEEIQKVSELYCNFVCDTLAILIRDALVRAVTEDVTIPEAPEADTEELVRFFLHPPSDLEKIRSSIV